MHLTPVQFLGVHTVWTQQEVITVNKVKSKTWASSGVVLNKYANKQKQIRSLNMLNRLLNIKIEAGHTNWTQFSSIKVECISEKLQILRYIQSSVGFSCYYKI